MIKFIRSCASGTKSQSTSQSVSLKRTKNVTREEQLTFGMYDAMFAADLRLLLTALHHQLVDFLGLSVSQIAPNAWRTFIGAEILWGSLSGGNRQLTLDEFFYCYRPHHIASSKGAYHFSIKENDLKLVSNMPDSNRNWKSGISLLKGWIGCAVRKNGRRCLAVTLTTHGLLFESQVEPVNHSFAYFILTLLIPSTFSCL